MFFEEVASQQRPPKTANQKQEHFNLRYKMKTGQQKKYEPAASEKSRSFNSLSNPTATKTKALKRKPILILTESTHRQKSSH